MDLIDQILRTDTLRSIKDVLSREGGEYQKGTGWYRAAYVYGNPRVRVSYGSLNPHAHVELSGLTCQQVRNEGFLDQLIEHNAHLASRYDIAQDFHRQAEGGLDKLNIDNTRVKARSHMLSQDGETIYLGSWHSERFCRIYQFHKPHPRAGLMRVEFVTRGDAAKRTAAYATRYGQPAVFAQLAAVFGVEALTGFSPAPAAPKIESATRGAAGNGHHRWVLQVALPAVVAAHRAGLLNLQETLDALQNSPVE